MPLLDPKASQQPGYEGQWQSEGTSTWHGRRGGRVEPTPPPDHSRPSPTGYLLALGPLLFISICDVWLQLFSRDQAYAINLAAVGTVAFGCTGRGRGREEGQVGALSLFVSLAHPTPARWCGRWVARSLPLPPPSFKAQG